MCRNFDGKYTCIGFPSRNGDASKAGVISLAELPVAIMANGNVEGSWDFAKNFFTESYQNSVVERGCGIPVLRDALDDWFAEGMARSDGLYYFNGVDNSFGLNSYIVNGQYLTVPRMLDSDIVCIKNSIENCNSREFTDYEILEIVREETNAYFAGGLTVENTAANIQDRVMDYLGSR